MFVLPTNSWKEFFDIIKRKPYFATLQNKVLEIYKHTSKERISKEHISREKQNDDKDFGATFISDVNGGDAVNNKKVFPPFENIFEAFRLCDFVDLKVVILGQDPYHGFGQAHGLAFSTKDSKLPKSLINIFTELKSDLGVQRNDGDLSDWARSGVLLLNTVLTVEESSPLSHVNLGWQEFTKDVLNYICEKVDKVIFVLWGNNAKAYRQLIADTQNSHFIIFSAHPSPLSAHRGFFGSRPFSRINEKLREWGKDEIEWDTSGAW